MGYFKALAAGLTSPIFFFLVICTFLVMASTAGFFLVREETVNPAVSSYFDAFYLTVTTATGVGYGDVVPQSTGGKITAMLLMLFGTLIFVSFTAVLASSIIEADEQLRKRLDGED